MRFAHRVGLAAGAVAAVVALAGCGSSGDGTLLTEGAATQLTSELTQASRALDDYNCNVAYTAITEYKDDVNQLTGVNATLVEILAQGGSRISTLANQRCPSGVSPATTTSTSTGTRTTGTTTGASVTTTSPGTTTTTTTTTTSESDTGSGGAAPTTQTSPPVVSTSTVTSTPQTTSTPDSGGAGLNSSGGAGTGGTGVGNGQ